MTKEQKESVIYVYNHLLQNENRIWTALDDYLDYLEYLGADQLLIEANTIFVYHNNNRVRCEKDHPQEHCFIPLLVEACGAILDLHKETTELHEKNRYILQYYLAMNHAGLIVVPSES